MKPLHIGVAIVVLAGGVGAGAYAAKHRSQPPPVAQPIAFSHAKHTGDGEKSPKLACVECHRGAEKSAAAGIPSLDRCLQCHMKPQSDKEGERAVREAAARGGPFAFNQVTQNAGHVYFSHRAHTVDAKIACAQCHGDVTKWTAPPTHAEPRLMSMDACVDCHRTRGGSTACITCHR